jgi:hypothetical protein
MTQKKIEERVHRSLLSLLQAKVNGYFPAIQWVQLLNGKSGQVRNRTWPSFNGQ